MIVVLFTNCGGCKIASDFAPKSWERVTLGSWRNHSRQTQIKKALFRLKHDKQFPCLLSEDLQTIMLKDKVEEHIENGTLKDL